MVVLTLWWDRKRVDLEKIGQLLLLLTATHTIALEEKCGAQAQGALGLPMVFQLTPTAQEGRVSPFHALAQSE